MSSDPSDLELLGCIRKGDADAMGIVLERYWAPVVRHAAAILGSTCEAEDVAQETFVRIWERREAWKLEGSLRGLLFQIARNLSLDGRRRRLTRNRKLRLLPNVSHAPSPEEHVLNAELGDTISRALDALPERRREVFLLVRHHGLSHREVAQLLSLSPQAVANHVTLALRDLRAALSVHFANFPADGQDSEDGQAALHSA